MESIIIYLSEQFETSVELFWFPVTIWSVVVLVLWAALRNMNNLHPQIHYHMRLAMLISLPVGLLVSGVLHLTGVFLSSGAEEVASLKVFVVMSPVEITMSAAEPERVLSTLQLLYAFLSIVIILGIAGLTARFLYRYFILSRMKRAYSMTDPDEIAGLSEENREIIRGLSRKVRFAFIAEEFIPVTFGFLNPVILLPEAVATDSEKLNMSVRHELTHIMENDFISHLSVVFTQALFWFHPMVYLLKRELVEFRELRCDLLVLQEKSVSRKRYASLLLELMPKENVERELSVNMAQESSNLKKRIQMITQITPNRIVPKRISLTVFTGLFLGLVLFMACTEMQSHDSLQSQELEILTYPDLDGRVGYHRVVVILGDETQSAQNDAVFAGLRNMESGHWMSMRELSPESAVASYGDRAAYGAVEIHTNIAEESYNLVLTALGLSPQNLDLYDPEEEQDFFVVVEQMPELIGGLAQLQRQIRYPEMARMAGIEGRVYIQFIVNEEGEVEHPRVVRGIGGGADEEALRVVRDARFTPGFQRGRPVRVQYSLPILFRIANGGNQAESDTEEASLPQGQVMDELVISGYTVNMEPPTVEGAQMVITIRDTQNDIRGRVVDAASGEPLVGASVVQSGTNRGAATDLEGYFTLNDISRDQMDLTISFVGYEPVQIRGGGEIGIIGMSMDDSNPLYIIDGVISSDMGSLSPDEIQSIEILKGDAAVEAYGSAGADGVVIITRKSGSN